MYEIEENNENVIVKTTTSIYSVIVKEQEKETIKLIENYCKDKGLIPNIIIEEKLEEVLRLGIAELNKREGGIKEVIKSE